MEDEDAVFTCQWLFKRKADIVHSNLGWFGLLKVFSFDKSSPVNFLKEIILRITKILWMQRGKPQTPHSSEKFRIFLISPFLQVTCCWCCQMLLLLLLLWLWYRRYERQASDVLSCYTISPSWHNDTDPASDWPLLPCPDLWLASRGQNWGLTSLPTSTWHKRPAAAVSHFLLPGFRG